MRTITVGGGGIAGPMASIASAEAGGRVHVFEAHRRLGGRARSPSGPFVTNVGRHALYCDSPWWAWLAERQLLPPVARPPLTGTRLRLGQKARRLPPRAFEEACACGQSERGSGDEYERSVRLLATVYTMTTARVPSQ
jgi:phytoene dehydrogenase-like protein